jgi:RNA polymerase sigma factor (TIGR02999 family)
MSEVTRLLNAAEAGDAAAAGRLLPLVYEELRRLATARLAAETPGQSLQATALVHEAYLRLVRPDPDAPWNGRGHFFAAAAEAMRRVLIERARRRRRARHGGGRVRVDLERLDVAAADRSDDLLAVDEALTQLSAADPQAAQLVKLRYYAGLSIPQAAEALGISPRSANFLWAYARSWLFDKLEGDPAPTPGSGGT